MKNKYYDINNNLIKFGDTVKTKWRGQGIIILKGGDLCFAFESGKLVFPVTQTGIKEREIRIIKRERKKW